jgi:Acetyltransferase (GNAT) family.
MSYIVFLINYTNPLSTKNNTYYKTIHCCVESLYTETKYRNKGYATLLLIHLKQCCKNIGVHFITLDDCSDNFNRPKNIYVNNGFNYLANNEPEMIFKFKQ